MRLFIFTVLILLVVFSQVNAQSTKRDSFTVLYEKDSCKMVDPSKLVVIGDISLKGNNITRDRIIMREMELSEGDTLNMHAFCRLAMQSRSNLLNRGLFNFVTVDTTMANGNHPIINLEYSFIERWYVWPMPIFELADRNFNSWLDSKDWSRVNYGVFITHNNFRGRMEKLKLLLRAGYNQNFMLRYEIPYLTHKQDLGMGVWIGHSRSREIPYAISNDKLVFYKNELGYARNDLYANLLITYRKGYRNLHTFMFGFERYNYADTLLDLNSDFTVNRSLKATYLNFYYQFKHDRRDYLPYPLSGHYFDVEFMKRGLGFPDKKPDFYYIRTTFDVYTPIANRWFWATNLTAKISGGGEQPFHMRRGLGYGNDFVRSYELYVIDGESFGLMKNNIKFAVLTPRVTNINFLPTERFSKIHYAIYANIFFDGGYVSSDKPWPDSRMQNKLIYGTGIGLDFVTYYDMVFRIEYGINMFNETGFFLHFVAPI